MKKFKFLLTAMLLACSSMSFAQFMNSKGSSSAASTSDVAAWHGLRFSYDRTFMSYDYDLPDDVDAQNMNGFSIDYVHAFKIAKSLPLFIETGAGLNFARWSESESYEAYGSEFEIETSITTLGLTIPVNLVYGIGINDKLTLKPFTGFYLRANLMGKGKETYTVDGESEDETFNLFDKDDMTDALTDKWNRVQVGWQIGTTLDINKFNVGIGYALDFNEIAKKQKTSKFQIRLGYNF